MENRDDLCAHLMANSAHCDVHHVEAPYFSHFTTTKVNIVSPLVAILAPIHNSQVVIQDYEYTFFNKNGVPIAHDLSGRAIIVRKSAYLI